MVWRLFQRLLSRPPKVIEEEISRFFSDREFAMATMAPQTGIWGQRCVGWMGSPLFHRHPNLPQQKTPRFEAPNAAANDSDKASNVADFKTLIRHSNTFGKVKIGVDVSDIIRITGFSAIIRNHPLICAGSLLHNLEGSDPWPGKGQNYCSRSASNPPLFHS